MQVADSSSSDMLDPRTTATILQVTIASQVTQTRVHVIWCIGHSLFFIAPALE